MIKTVVKIALIISLTVLSSTAVFAAVIEGDTIKAEVKQKVLKSLKMQGELKARVGGVPFRTLEIPNGEKRIDVSLNSSDFSPRKIAIVTIQVNGKRIRKFSVPVMLKLYDKVWVATDNIKRGQSLGFMNVSLERKDITTTYKKVMRGDKNLSNSIAYREIRAGKIIDKRYVISKPDVSKNSVVSVIFETGGINIAIDGEAMDNASVGDFVKVKSARYKKYYTGKVISPNKVLVRM